jgi:hypothetical protein
MWAAVETVRDHRRRAISRNAAVTLLWTGRELPARDGDFVLRWKTRRRLARRTVISITGGAIPDAANLPGSDAPDWLKFDD